MAHDRVVALVRIVVFALFTATPSLPLGLRYGVKSHGFGRLSST